MYCDTERALITTSIENKITSASLALMPNENDTADSTDSKTASPASETDSTEEDDDDSTPDGKKQLIFQYAL